MGLVQLPGSRRRFEVRYGLLASLVLFAGCGGPGQGTVSGKVMFNGAPLPGGNLLFRPADPKANSVLAEIDEQGNYSAILPVGEVKVLVDNRELEPRGSEGPAAMPVLPPELMKKLGGGMKTDKSATSAKALEQTADKPHGKYVPIPDRYYDTESSRLEFTVHSGDQKHDIELKK